MSNKVIRLKKGFDIKIEGNPAPSIRTTYSSSSYAVKPSDYLGIAPIPKMEVSEGDKVKAGTPLFHDKPNPSVKFCSPVSGEIVAINRGEKRAIVEVVVLADKNNDFVDFGKGDPNSMERDAIVDKLKQSGLWPALVQRPFGHVADSTVVPRDIFISGFDSAPNAVDYNFTMKGSEDLFQIGINALNQLTSGKVHLSLDATKKPCDTFNNADNVVVHWFQGPHPAGNVGVQIHHIAPINKGETVWTIRPDDVVAMGRLFRDGQYNTERTFAVSGSEIKHAEYFKAYLGANIEKAVEGNLHTDNVRYISGNVLTGTKINGNGHISAQHNQVTVIAEGDDYELLGWLLPSYPRPSFSSTYPAFIYHQPEYRVNTNTNGEERAFVVSGQYEAVTPMDILPEHLIKAILVEDFDLIEGLGIYEVLEEDLALCEFACTSKIPVQSILRDGLEFMKEQV